MIPANARTRLLSRAVVASGRWRSGVPPRPPPRRAEGAVGVPADVATSTGTKSGYASSSASERSPVRIPGDAPAVAYARKRNMLDGALLWRFVALDAPMQFEIAAAIGTKVETLLDNLLEIDMMAVFT